MICPRIHSVGWTSGLSAHGRRDTTQSMNLVLLTALAMVAFAANWVLARLAFATAGAEPLSYTGIRVAAGAITLAALLLFRRQPLKLAGSWAGAAALFGY